MPTWSGTRKKLETDYLCPALRGRVQYFATTYKKCPDHEGRAAILVDGEETDITDALAQEGGYLYEGDGFEVAVNENGVAMVTAYGDNGMSVSYSTEQENVQGGTVYNVTTDGDGQDLHNYNIITDVKGAEVLTEGEGMSTYEVTAGDSGTVIVKSATEK